MISFRVGGCFANAGLREPIDEKSIGLGFVEIWCRGGLRIAKLKLPLSPSTNFPFGRGFVEKVGRDGGGQVIKATYIAKNRPKICNYIKENNLRKIYWSGFQFGAGKVWGSRS